MIWALLAKIMGQKVCQKVWQKWSKVRKMTKKWSFLVTSKNPFALGKYYIFVILGGFCQKKRVFFTSKNQYFCLSKWCFFGPLVQQKCSIFRPQKIENFENEGSTPQKGGKLFLRFLGRRGHVCSKNRFKTDFVGSSKNHLFDTFWPQKSRFLTLFFRTFWRACPEFHDFGGT